MTKNITRASQLTKRHQPFSPFNSARDELDVGLMSLVKGLVTFGDEMLDGVTIPIKGKAVHWTEENDVHGSLNLSSQITSSRPFLGAGTLVVRDEVRGRSHVAVVDNSGLSLVTIKDNAIDSKQSISEGSVLRATVCLDKYTGLAHVLYVQETADGVHLYLDGKLVKTKSVNVDFPFIGIAQPTIGHVATQASDFGLITYKCRDTGVCYVRTFVDGALGEEVVLSERSCIGGIDFCIGAEEAIFRMNALNENQLVPAIARTKGHTLEIPQFKPLDFGDFEADQVLPVNAAVTMDHLGTIHVPVEVQRGDYRYLLNFIPVDDHVVEAMRLEGGGQFTMLAFPKKETMTTALGRGDGVSGGLGIIASGTQYGDLFTSNSQTAGIHFPSAKPINHEMPHMFAFAATECYTRGVKANMVSMDYLFLEANGNGDPESPVLMLETWDMPLPQPTLQASSLEKGVISLEIGKDGLFFEGKTTFELSDPSIQILSAEILDSHNANLTVDRQDFEGVVVSFEMKDLFYFHAGRAVIV